MGGRTKLQSVQSSPAIGREPYSLASTLKGRHPWTNNIATKYAKASGRLPVLIIGLCMSVAEMGISAVNYYRPLFLKKQLRNGVYHPGEKTL